MVLLGGYGFIGSLYNEHLDFIEQLKSWHATIIRRNKDELTKHKKWVVGRLFILTCSCRQRIHSSKQGNKDHVHTLCNTTHALPIYQHCNLVL